MSDIKRGTARRLGLDLPRYEAASGHPATGMIGEDFSKAMVRLTASLNRSLPKRTDQPPVLMCGSGRTRSCPVCGYFQVVYHLADAIPSAVHRCLDGDTVTVVRWDAA